MSPKQRDDPYSAFNFLVDLGTGDTAKVSAGFQEVAGLGMEVAIGEYRSGNDKANRTRKYTGIFKSGDVTMKRGLIASTDLWEWIKVVREGDRAKSKRTVTVQLRDEAASDVVMTWKLTGAQPIKWTGPALNAKGSEVAIEELVLSVEQTDVE